MNKETLQAQRNELANHSEETLARIKELDEQIEAADKPELRHGEIVMFNSDLDIELTRIMLHDEKGELRPYNLNGSAQHNEHTKYTGTGKTIFDDIASKGETLEKDKKLRQQRDDAVDACRQVFAQFRNCPVSDGQGQAVQNCSDVVEAYDKEAK